MSMGAGCPNPQQHARRHVEAAATTAAGPRATRRILRQPQPLETPRTGYPSVQRQIDVMQVLSAWALSELPRFTKPSELCWQPSDLLPDPSSESFFQQLSALREEATRLPNDVLVVLAGLVVVLSTIPNQQSSWCATPTLAADTGADQQPWPQWRRSWSADRNRHRQLLLTYCYCCGAIDSRALDISMQHAIAAGSSSGSGSSSSSGRSGDVYQQLMRSTFQGRMSRVMFSNLSNVASYHGAAVLSEMAAAVAADEARHELAQVSAVTQIFQQDPQGAILALTEVVKSGVTLPGCRMDDEWHTTQGNINTMASRVLSSGQNTSDQQLPTLKSSQVAAATAAAAGVDAVRDIRQAARQVDHGHTTGQNGDISSSGGDDTRFASKSTRSHSGSQCSQLYVDFMAAADAVGVFTVNDTAAAVEQCCSVWKVAEIRPSTEEVSAAQQYLLEYDGQLRRLAEIQLEGRLRAAKRDRLRTANFSWVDKREVVLG